MLLKKGSCTIPECHLVLLFEGADFGVCLGGREWREKMGYITLLELSQIKNGIKLFVVLPAVPIGRMIH